jgi:hypothetical protein
MSETNTVHTCDRRCSCPIHGTQLVYWPAGDDHACQDIDCKYGHGGCDPYSVAVGQERYLWNLRRAAEEDVRRGWSARDPDAAPTSTAFGMFQVSTSVSNLWTTYRPDQPTE